MRSAHSLRLPRLTRRAAHPWHGGSVLIICAWFLLARTAPAGATLAVALWVGTHVAVVLLEEGLTCGPFAPEAYTAPLPEGAHPFYDGGIREAVRLSASCSSSCFVLCCYCSRSRVWLLLALCRVPRSSCEWCS
jgi:hypothetical protein